ncbi:MAG: ABC transporter substrate-binding protein [Nocardioides sp.]|nr:ABC transporter substrate-binding protein [Nocardioides sp.]
MIRSSRAWRTTAVLGVAAVALAACGGDEDPGTTESSSSSEAAAGDGTLTVGTLLPQTGSLAFLGPPEFAGVQLAVDDINAAGGVLGKDMVKIDGDSGDTTTDIASQTSDRLISEDVDAIIGAASSGVSLTVIDKITGAGVVHFSPANTSPAFTDYDDKGLYFRTAPSDALQGRVLGNLLIEDGFLDIGIMALDDAYGNGLADAVESTVGEGGGSATDKIIYNPEAATFSAEVGQLKASNPEAIVVIGFEETKKILPELIAQGIGPDTVPLYLVDGNLADYSADFQPGTLAGTKGTLPGGPPKGEEFNQRLLAVDPSLTDFSYSKESYDATLMIALAAIAAESDSGEAIAGKLVEISTEGEKCTEFKECADLLADGTDIDYDGQSGPVDFTDKGEPRAATIGIYEYGEDNTYTNLEYVEGEV